MSCTRSSRCSELKKEDVSQDDSFLEGHQKAAYAIDEHGKYVVVPSRGYADEVVATTVALQAQDRLIQIAWENARRGAQSPLAYHLAVKQLTLGLAAAQMGIWRARVWWHLKPAGFRRLSSSCTNPTQCCLSVSSSTPA